MFVPSRHTYDRLQVEIFPNRISAGRSAARSALSTLNEALSRDGEARVILASAPSQNELLGVLTGSEVDWSKVTVFHMDEYVGLTSDHPASFRAYQRQRILSRITPNAFHGIKGESQDLEAECARYTALLREGSIDLVCLGIGENGHLAFNDPPVADFDDPEWVKKVELDPACRQQQVNDGCFPSLEAVPRYALTLTLPALLSAKTIVGVVPGKRKAPAVRDTLLGPISTACPASILRTHPNATLFLDADAGALLPRS